MGTLKRMKSMKGTVPLLQTHERGWRMTPEEDRELRKDISTEKGSMGSPILRH